MQLAPCSRQVRPERKRRESSWRIGFLSGRARPETFEGDAHGAFLEGMRELGYREGVDFTVEWRFAAGQFDRLPELAAELVRANVDVIVSSPAIATRAARDATKAIPVIFAYVSNPWHPVLSEASPGRAATSPALRCNSPTSVPSSCSC